MASSVKIAEQYEPKVQKAVLQVFNALRDEFVQKRFVEALEFGGLAGAIKYINDLPTSEIIDQYLVRLLNDLIADGGDNFYSEVPEEAKEKNYFGYALLAGLTINQIKSYQQALSDAVRDNTLEALRNRLFADYKADINYQILARDIRNTIGLAPRDELAVRNYENNLRNLNRNSLYRMLRDKRFDPTIERAIKEGKNLTEAQITNMVNRYRERFVNFRAKTISQDEAFRAVGLGQYTAGLQALNQGAVDGIRTRRFWIHMHDDKVRDAHRAVPRMNPEGVPLDGVFQTPLGEMRYPRDPLGVSGNVYGCRCWIKIKTISK